MSAMAEVIDESIRNMTSNMVTKAAQEKVRLVLQYIIIAVPGGVCGALIYSRCLVSTTASLHSASRFRTAQIRAPTDGEERPRDDESRERSAGDGHREAEAASARGDHAHTSWSTIGFESGERYASLPGLVC